MKHLIVPLFLAFTVSCSEGFDSDSELRKADAVLRGYFDAVSRWDYDEMRKLCSSDFRLFEDGEIWTVVDHINFLRQYEGKASIAYEFMEVTSGVEGNTAWFTYRNRAKAQIESQPISFEWIESAVLHKKNGEWNLILLHSTTAKKPQKQETTE